MEPITGSYLLYRLKIYYEIGVREAWSGGQKLFPLSGGVYAQENKHEVT